MYTKRRTDIARKRRLATDLIRRANEVSIFSVLQDFLDVRVPESDRSWKDYCPFGVEHNDGGRDKTWRVYGSTNSSYCFAMHGSMDNVRLVQIKYGDNAIQAARRILQNYGLMKQRPYWERFSELVAERETRQADTGNLALVVEALHIGLAQDPRYGARQFDPDVTAVLEQNLQKLEGVKAQDGELREWLRAAKADVLRILGESGDGEGDDEGESASADEVGDSDGGSGDDARVTSEREQDD